MRKKGAKQRIAGMNSPDIGLNVTKIKVQKKNKSKYFSQKYKKTSH